MTKGRRALLSMLGGVALGLACKVSAPDPAAPKSASAAPDFAAVDAAGGAVSLGALNLRFFRQR
jgi:hypothetical protein